MARWKSRDEPELSHESLRALLDNEIPAVRMRRFAAPEECTAFARAVEGAALKYYSVGRRIGYIGMAQYEYRWDKPKDAYFRDVPAANARIREVFERSWDPIRRVIDRVQAVWPHPVGIANEPGLGEYFGGIIRVASEGVDLHADFAPYNSPAYSISAVDAQLGWNFFAEELVTGGETTVYNAPWTPAVARGEIPKSYGLTRESLQGAETYTYVPKAGDVVIFNNRNPHEIAGGVAGPGRNRISIGAFFGRMPGGELVMWS